MVRAWSAMARLMADPPRGVGAELVALGRIELLHGAQQPDVAFLDQVEEGDAAPHVALGDRDDQPQVGADQRRLGFLGQLVDLVGLGAQHARLGRPAKEGARGGEILGLRQLRAQLLLDFDREQITGQDDLEGVARHVFPGGVAAPQAVAQPRPQVGGGIALPAAAQVNRLRQQQAQVGGALPQPACVLQHPLPRGAQIVVQTRQQSGGRVSSLAPAGAHGRQQVDPAGSLHTQRQPQLLIRPQELHAPDLFQVEANGIIGQLEGGGELLQVELLLAALLGGVVDLIQVGLDVD